MTFSATYALHNYFNFDKRAVFVDYLTPIQASNERVYPIISIPPRVSFLLKSSDLAESSVHRVIPQKKIVNRSLNKSLMLV